MYNLFIIWYYINLCLYIFNVVDIIIIIVRWIFTETYLASRRGTYPWKKNKCFKRYFDDVDVRKHINIEFANFSDERKSFADVD